MNYTKAFLVVGFSLLLLAPGKLNAQESDPYGQLWYVWEATVKPGQNNRYLELSEKIVATCKAEVFPYSFYVWANPVFHYTWYYPIDDIKETELINRAWFQIAEKLEPGIREAFFSTLDSYEERVLYERNDLSYLPDDTTLSINEATYVFKQTFHIHPGEQHLMEQYIKEFNNLLKVEGISSSMRTATGILGYENPSYILFDYGKNVVDFWINYGKTQSQLGDSLVDLNSKITSYIRKSQAEMLWYVEPYSYQVKK
jgi:hypothetical protein